MSEITKEPCPKCGLIQLKDVIWGLAICDSADSLTYGCPSRKHMERICEDARYDEEIYKNRIEKPNFKDFI